MKKKPRKIRYPKEYKCPECKEVFDPNFHKTLGICTRKGTPKCCCQTVVKIKPIKRGRK